ncbi:MAG: zinc-dependent alcohol dehydrogenase family protein [Kofleriaceae bacterium]
MPQEVIEAVELEWPKLAPGEVLIELLAAPINPSDVLTLTGEYGILPPLPAFAGNEGVGKVVEHGPGVTSPPLGQVVLLPVGIGTWSTHLVAPAAGLVALPAGVDPQQLAMLSINPPTASLMLSEFVELSAGDWVIQNAANSSVGAYLIQLARMRGLRTVNVVRRAALVEPLRAAGADVVLVDGPELPVAVKDATGGAKIRLGIDAVGGEGTASLGACLASEATLVNYGAMSGKPCTLSAGLLIFKDLRVRGFWLAKWFRTASKEQQGKLYGELTRSIATGALKAPIHQTYAVKDIKEAVAAAAAGERDGKILVVP